MLPDLIANYEAWEKEHCDANGLFWQIDDRDGMEVSIGGGGRGGYRATINGYMYGDAMAIARIAELGRKEVAERVPRQGRRNQATDGGETLGPGRVVLQSPSPRREYLFATFANSTDTPHGTSICPTPTSRAPGNNSWTRGLLCPLRADDGRAAPSEIRLSYQGHECQWNGPSWPFSTAITLTGMANLLNDYRQDVVSRKDYLELLRIYTHSHRRTCDDGTVVPWIDENLNPLTGDWISPTRLKSWKNGHGRRQRPERGKDYNHSTYCDLVINGLIGLRPHADDAIEVNPLIPAGCGTISAWTRSAITAVG